MPHVKIEIVCTDDMVEEIVSIIEKEAHSCLRGDGKIYISSINAAVRIETTPPKCKVSPLSITRSRFVFMVFACYFSLRHE